MQQPTQGMQPGQAIQYGQSTQYGPGTQPMQGMPQPLVVNQPTALYITSEGMFQKGYTVTDATGAVVYNAEIHAWGRPNLRVSSGAGEVGSGNFHKLSHNVDMNVRGRSMDLSKDGAFSFGYHWSSAAVGGRQLHWRSEGNMSYNRACYVDGDSNPVARWDNATGSRKARELLVFHPNLSMPGSAGLDELVVSALAVMESARRKTVSSASGFGLAGSLAG